MLAPWYLGLVGDVGKDQELPVFISSKGSHKLQGATPSS